MLGFELGAHNAAIILLLPGFMKHSFHDLRQQRLLTATRPFKARGHSLIRCPSCLVGQDNCICHARSLHTAPVDFVLLMHRDEILKPTNTGRLIADILPQNTFAFCWERQEPPAALALLLNDKQRVCVLVFPGENSQPINKLMTQSLCGQQRLTLILLDGTWKQARKMYNRSDWLQHLACVSCQAIEGHYRLRQAAHQGCLSTAEAAISLLQELEVTPAAEQLQTYFSLFNQRYLATRGLRPEQCETQM